MSVLSMRSKVLLKRSGIFEGRAEPKHRDTADDLGGLRCPIRNEAVDDCDGELPASRASGDEHTRRIFA